jgi:hypothetical protein
LVWVIYPPNFDSDKKYPTLLYCQGGPQSPLTQSYSFRWNFQLMAGGVTLLLHLTVVVCMGTEEHGMNRSVRIGADK